MNKDNKDKTKTKIETKAKVETKVKVETKAKASNTVKAKTDTKAKVSKTSESIDKVNRGKRARLFQRTNKGRIYISATFNNTLVNITDEQGNAICWGTTGSSGFKGSRKSTPFAATSAVEKTVKKAQSLGIDQVQCFIKGPGPGREAALRVLRSSGLRISMIADVTPMPHNGCRPKKRRRV